MHRCKHLLASFVPLVKVNHMTGPVSQGEGSHMVGDTGRVNSLRMIPMAMYSILQVSRHKYNNDM